MGNFLLFGLFLSMFLFCLISFIILRFEIKQIKEIEEMKKKLDESKCVDSSEDVIEDLKEVNK